MAFVAAPTNTYVSLTDEFTVTTVNFTDTGYQKFDDVQSSYNTKIYYGPGAKRTPKVITFKKNV